MNELDRQGLIIYGPGRPALKQYMTEDSGVAIGTVWDDIPAPRLSGKAREFAQKPLSLLERIVALGSNPGDTVLDPFCGSGTALVAAQSMQRSWIGGDVSDAAVRESEHRLESDCHVHPGRDYENGDQKCMEGRCSVISRVSGPSDTKIDMFTLAPAGPYFKDKPMPIEETREYEFKEMRGRDPVAAISQGVDKYVVSFLNSGGGRIYWGVRDHDRVVVGVPLDSHTRDELRLRISDTLKTTQPPIRAEEYKLTCHPIYEQNGNLIDGLYLVEVRVPNTRSAMLYSTAAGDTWMKADGNVQKLSAAEIVRIAHERSQPASSP